MADLGTRGMKTNYPAEMICDPEDRWVAPGDEAAVREKMLDKTLADSFPASDPPSSLPNPSADSLGQHGLQPVNMDDAA